MQLKRHLSLFAMGLLSFGSTLTHNVESTTLSPVAECYAGLKDNFQTQHGNMYIPEKKASIIGYKAKKESHECPFCMQIAETNDLENLILGRSLHSIIALNFYPYTDGHMLIIPQRHVGNLSDLSKEERTDLMELVNLTADILKEVLHADGINVGINMGRAAGASIPAHIHIQILPRWEHYKDSFIQIYNNISVITCSLPEMYALLAPAFKEKLEAYNARDSFLA